MCDCVILPLLPVAFPLSQGNICRSEQPTELKKLLQKFAPQNSLTRTHQIRYSASTCSDLYRCGRED